VPILIVPLRERKEDIPILAEQFRQRFARKHGIDIHGLSPSSMSLLMDHSWPGNVRELQNVLERAVILCNEGGMLESVHLGMSPLQRPASATPASAPALPAGSNGEFLTLSEIESNTSWPPCSAARQPDPCRPHAFDQHPHPPQQAQRV
jgi:transcriptional regulator with PAS, ATPase and Fis domain